MTETGRKQPRVQGIPNNEQPCTGYEMAKEGGGPPDPMEDGQGSAANAVIPEQ